MDNDTKPGLSGIKSSDTVIDLKASKNEGSSSSEANPEKKAKPPPLDVIAAQEYEPEMESGPKTPASAPPLADRLLDKQKFKERKIGHRRVDQEGKITFKKIGTSVIMQSIQLGIGHAVGSLASKPERDLLMLDFTIVETSNFPSDGSNVTPAHSFSSFKFKNYAPIAFRYFRDLFGIAPDDFLLSLCHYPMRELSNPGASGSIFYVSDDDAFIIKTVQKGEGDFLQKLLPGYYMNLNQNPRTLLPKFFGLYCYQCSNKNIRLIVMNNLLPSCLKMHEKYDLKGSTYKRKASKSERKKGSPTYKDLDFIERHPEGILLDHNTYNTLIKTMQRDCRVLESFEIMDYSLLVGIHNLDLARKEEQTEPEDNDSSEQISSEKSDKSLKRSKSINIQRERLAPLSTTMESIQGEGYVDDEKRDDIPPGGIPAKNAKGESLILFLGIIDILQSYRLMKKLEHSLKSVLHDGDTISVHRPGFYSNRFLQFMSKTVFKKMPATGTHRKFKTMVSSVLALKQSPSKRKKVARKSSAEARPYLPKSQSEVECTEDEDFPSGTVPAGESTALCDKIPNNEKNCTEDKQNGRANPDSMPLKLTSANEANPTSVSWDKSEVISLSQVTLQTESTVEYESSSSSGIGSTFHSVAWTPPRSIEGSTPTHTEGTPSYTESSSSGDAACPTTPVKSINKSVDSLPPLGETQILQGNEMMSQNFNCDMTDIVSRL